jgi:hypothetical protein
LTIGLILQSASSFSSPSRVEICFMMMAIKIKKNLLLVNPGYQCAV